jgi:hypothetical protein
MDALVVGITTRKVNCMLDADIRSLFDSVDQTGLSGLWRIVSATDATLVT